MTIQAVVKRKRKARKGKGFSREELREVGLSLGEALKQKIPIDTRRSTKHEENVEMLKTALEPIASVKEVRILELTEVEGIGLKTAKKLKEAGIENVNALATSSPQRVAEVLGSSETRAARFIEDARSLLKE